MPDTSGEVRKCFCAVLAPAPRFTVPSIEPLYPVTTAMVIPTLFAVDCNVSNLPLATVNTFEPAVNELLPTLIVLEAAVWKVTLSETVSLPIVVDVVKSSVTNAPLVLKTASSVLVGTVPVDQLEPVFQFAPEAPVPVICVALAPSEASKKAKMKILFMLFVLSGENVSVYCLKIN